MDTSRMREIVDRTVDRRLDEGFLSDAKRFAARLMGMRRYEGEDGESEYEKIDEEREFEKFWVYARTWIMKFPDAIKECGEDGEALAEKVKEFAKYVYDKGWKDGSKW